VITRRELLLGLLVASCSKRTGASDASGAALRIVSLSPSTTETVAALGALSLLVGRSRFCDFPAEVRSLPDVGGYIDPNLEAILALSPTLVVGARGPAGAQITDKLGERGIATYFPQTESLAQIQEMIHGMGARTKHDVDARVVNQAIQERVDAIARSLAGVVRPRALLLFGIQPIVAAGKQTFADEVLSLAGADNAVSGIGYPTLDIEALVALDPDVLLNAASSEEHGAEKLPTSAAGWRDLRAVRQGRVVLVTDETVLRPGPRIGEGLTVLARAVHGDRLP
jgi:iron complex transport system substrate-binding protein